MQPVVSIIVPVYNNEKYIEKCIESLINQTLKSIEIILVDDGSIDKSGEICDIYAKKDARIRVIHKKNEGLGLTRNCGLAVARGKYFAFVDSDDYVDITMYEKMYKEIHKINADICIGGSYRVLSDGTILPFPLCMREGKYDKEDIRNIVLPQIIGAAPEAKEEALIGYSMNLGMYSMDIVRKHSLEFFSERIYIQEDILFKIPYYCLAEKMVIMQEPFYYYRYNKESLSNTYRADRFDKTTISFKKEFEIINRWNVSKGKEYAARMYLADVRSCMRQAIKAERYRYAYQEIKRMATHPFIEEIISCYPYNKNPLAKKIFGWLLHRKHYIMLFGLLFIDNIRKKE